MIELRRTIRRLLHAPGFTLAIVLTLALGIGATIAIFTVVNGILLRPLPFPDSDRLVSLTHRFRQRGNSVFASPAIYFTYRDSNRTFESVALYMPQFATVTEPGDPEQLRSMTVTFEFLPTLRVGAELGRAFVAADDRPDSAPTVMLSHAYWQRHFGGAENALGQDLVIDGTAHSIIGVLPRDFRFLQRPAEVLVPMRPDPALAFVGPIGERGVARLRDGITLEDANADVGRMIPLVAERFPPAPGTDTQVFRNQRLEPDVKPLKETFVGDLDDVLLVLMGTIGLLLAVACANVANLHLVRTDGRAYELAVRSALGASRGRIARDLLRESLLLGVVGGVLGLGLAALALPVLVATAARELPSVLAVTIDLNVLAFAITVSLVSGVVFGTAPVLRYAGPRVAGTLRAASRTSSTSRERHRVHRGLIAAQVAFALILLVASGLMIRTFQSLLDVDPGFVAPDEVQTVSVSLPPGAVPEMPQVIRRFEQMQDAVASLAGVESVGFAQCAPLAGLCLAGGFLVENSTLPEGAAPPIGAINFASPRYFETLGTPLVAGRTFEWVDHHDGRPVVIVSDSVARREWGTPQNALGKRLRFSSAAPWHEVVGVVGDVHAQGLDTPPRDAVYLTLGEPIAQTFGRTARFAIRSDRVGTPGFVEETRRAIWSVDPSVPLFDVGTLGELHERATARTALTLLLLAITGGMALALGLVGIYSVIGYMLAQRTREIGIRVALGARNAALERMLLGRILMPVLVGVALGLSGAAALSGLIESLLYGVNALDPGTYALAALVLVATAVVAAYLPARRVARVDAMAALRAE
jgi:putative ABC transport system permease protein